MSMCRVFSCVAGRECLPWPVCSLEKTLIAFVLLHFVLCWSPAPAARESAWRDERCWQRMLSAKNVVGKEWCSLWCSLWLEVRGLHVYFKHQVFFYTLTKALVRGLTFSVPPHPDYCLIVALQTEFLLQRLAQNRVYLWLHCNSGHIPQFISYLSKSCLPLVS